MDLFFPEFPPRGFPAIPRFRFGSLAHFTLKNSPKYEEEGLFSSIGDMLDTGILKTILLWQ